MAGGKPGRPKGSHNASTPRANGVPKQGVRERRIAIRNVLDADELRFCQTYLAFGETDRAEAYRRAFHRKNLRGQWVDIPRDAQITPEELKAAPVLSTEDAASRAIRLLRQVHIRDTIEELKRSPADHARQTLVDNILFGSSTEKKEAIKQIFADEDKLGFKDASEKWAEIMADAGAEVVVPLGVITRTVQCSHCHEASVVEIDLAVEVPLSGFFSRPSADPPN